MPDTHCLKEMEAKKWALNGECISKVSESVTKTPKKWPKTGQYWVIVQNGVEL